MIVHASESRLPSTIRANLFVGAALLVLALFAEGIVSPYSLLSSIHDGLRAGVVIVPPMLAGVWLVRWSRIDSLPVYWQAILGAALGIGAFSILVLALGLAGALHRPVWIVILLLLTVVGLAGYSSLPGRRIRADAVHATDRPHRRFWLSVWLAACPFAVLALLAASNAPGFIWQEEGFGYDVLEYHLQLPKEYLDLGRIQYMPHNVYANFPGAVEMVYLAAMIVHADVVDMGTTANVIHLLLGALTVAAAWATGREWSPEAGMVGGVVFASTGWLSYLSGLAYVEHGMLFFGMTAVGLVLRLVRSGGEAGEEAAPHRKYGLIAAAGLSAGFAGGCKYTALPFIAFPLVVLIAVGVRQTVKRRLSSAFLFLSCTLVALSPWLAKNLVFTGNPVFPLANSLFQATPDGWGEAETRRWDDAHGVSSEAGGLGRRLQTAWHRTIGDPLQRIGPGIVLIALAGLLGRRRGLADGLLVLMLALQSIVWLLATHLFARFAVVMLIPLALLSARSVIGSAGRLRTTIVGCAVVAGALWNLYFAVRLHAQESPGGAPASLFYEGNIPGYEFFKTVNGVLPDDARILLAGEARAFYFQRKVDYCVTFNRSPFLVAVRSAQSPGDLMTWLREQRYTHLLVHWSELRRLSSTYGLSPSITPQELRDVMRRLMEAGVERVRAWPADRAGEVRVELFQLPG